MFFKKQNKKSNFDNIDIAICMLLIHAARVDEIYEDQEKKLIKEYFLKIGKDKEYITELVRYCEIKEKDSVEIINMTKEIKKLDYKNRLEIIEIMCKIIYSDRQLCNFEDRLIRKVSGLIYVENRDVGEIKLKVKNDIYS
jgi:uncharacterized tellurite resistance protein B-like protein